MRKGTGGLRLEMQPIGPRNLFLYKSQYNINLEETNKKGGEQSSKYIFSFFFCPQRFARLASETNAQD